MHSKEIPHNDVDLNSRAAHFHCLLKSYVHQHGYKSANGTDMHVVDA